MNLFNYIGVGRFNEGLKAVLGINDAGFTMLAPEVVPTFEINNVAPEMRRAMLERLCWGVAVSGAGVGTNSYVALHNPLNSRIVCVVERIEMYNLAAACTFQLSVLGTTGVFQGTAGTMASRDLRWTGGPTCSVRQGSDFTNYAGAITAGPRIRALQDTTYILSQPVVLGAGNVLIIYNASAQNESITASFSWRERVRTDAEATASGQ